jgi:hypothetical protein
MCDICDVCVLVMEGFTGSAMSLLLFRVQVMVMVWRCLGCVVNCSLVYVCCVCVLFVLFVLFMTDRFFVMRVQRLCFMRSCLMLFFPLIRK